MPATKPLKLRMYESVYRLNQNFEEVMRDLRALRDLEIFPQRFLHACEGRAEQLRADANHELNRVSGRHVSKHRPAAAERLRLRVRIPVLFGRV